MAEPLKNAYNEAYIQRLAKELIGAGMKMKANDFAKAIFDQDWKDRELKERMTHICQTMHHFMPSNFSKSCAILIKAGKGFGSYEAMFFPEYVSTYGLDDWKTSLETLEVLTTYSSAEFAIRPFLLKDPKKGMAQMLKWSRHRDDHVRRLSTEGARPLLPWSFQLPLFREDPTLCLEILEGLITDESLYVRKSVANHLNDISKDHPALALKVASRWIKNKNPETLWIVKHGLRTLLKEGNQKAMTLFGYAKKSAFAVLSFDVKQQFVSMGEHLEFCFDVNIKKKSQYRFEYALHFLKANGTYTKKVFKVSEKELSKQEYRHEKKHLFKPISTRKYHNGLHFVELIINGHSMGKRSFVLWNESTPYQVYMLLTESNTIYSGMTTDINRRYLEHRESKKGAKYTKANAPKALIYLETAENRSDAQKKEAALKKLSRKGKEKISWIEKLDI